MNLFNLTENQQKLKVLMEHAETQEDLEVAYDTYEALDLALEDKLIGYWYVYKEFEAREKSLQDAKKEIDQKLRTTRNKLNNFKENVQQAMMATDKQEVTDGVATINIQNNPPKVVITNEGNIPTDYLIQQPDKVNKNKIKSALQDGEVVNGAELVQEQSVRFK